MPEDSQIFFSAPRLVKDLDRETSHISAAFGLTFPQFMVMEALLHREQMTVGEIKDTILSTKGTIPVIINNLVRLGMVRRSKDPEDGRKSLIQLTDEGRALIERIWPVNEKMFTQRFSVWTLEEKQELLRLLSLYHKARKTGTDLQEKPHETQNS